MRNIILAGLVVLLSLACKKQESEKSLQVVFVEPLDNDTIIIGAVARLEVSGLAGGGELKTVHFIIDDGHPFVVTQAPFSCLWKTNNQSLGVHTITAKVWDDEYNNVSRTITVRLVPDNIVFNPDLSYGTVRDYDGNVYKTITIGTQTWMAEDLRTLRYSNGDNILGKKSGGSIGLNYSWYMVDSYKGLAPSGWHIPTLEEWYTLINYMGGANVAAQKLRETGTNHWASADGSINSSGFTAIPRDVNFLNCFWWTASDAGISEAWFINLGTNYVSEYSTNKTVYAGVRCVKD